MTRVPSILASGAAAAILLTSAMVLAQVQTVDTARKRGIATRSVPEKQAAQSAITNETRRLRQLNEARRLRQLSKQLQPFYRYELMHARTICGLTNEQLCKLRPDVDAAYERAIVKIAAANDEVLKSPTFAEVDYAVAIQEEVRAAVDRHVTPEQRAARNEDLRLQRQGRKEAGVDFLVATIDRELLLTERQRRQVAESLAAHWDDRWCDALELTLGGRMAIPEIPDRLVKRYLSVTQQETWHRIPRLQKRLWGVNIDHMAATRGMEQELGAAAKASPPARRLPRRLGPSAAENARRGKTG